MKKKIKLEKPDLEAIENIIKKRKQKLDIRRILKWR